MFHPGREENQGSVCCGHLILNYLAVSLTSSLLFSLLITSLYLGGVGFHEFRKSKQDFATSKSKSEVFDVDDVVNILFVFLNIRDLSFHGPRVELMTSELRKPVAVSSDKILCWCSIRLHMYFYSRQLVFQEALQTVSRHR